MFYRFLPLAPQRHAGFFVLYVLVVLSAVLPQNLRAQEEPRARQVQQVNIQGNESFPAVVLKDVIATKEPSFFRRLQFWRSGGFEFSELELRRDVIRLQRFYRRRGFYEISVNYEVSEGKNAHQREVLFIVDEGPPTRIRSLEVIYEDTPEAQIEEIKAMDDVRRADSRNPLKEGRRYEAVRHPDVEAAYLNALRNSGFAFAKAEIEATVDTLARQADVRVVMQPGEQAYFNNISVEGDLSVPAKLYRYHSGIRQGDLYSLRSMRNAQQLVFRHPLVRLVTLSQPEQAEGDSVDIRIRVREQALRTIELQGGLGNEELVRGQVSWTHRNPFGNGYRFNVSSRASFIEQRANVEYLIPGFLTPRSNLSFSPFGLRKNEDNFLIYQAGITNNLSYYRSQKLVGNLSYEFSLNDEALKDVDGARRDSSLIYNVSAVQLSGIYNESVGNRGRGWAVRPFAEFSGFFNTGSIVYQRFSLDVRRFIDLSSTTKLALRTDAGLLFSGDPFDTPANIRFYSGGTSSVRGWSRRQLGPKRAVVDDEGDFREYLPLGGQSMAMFNAEIRQELPFILNGLQIAAFLDGGQVWLNKQDTNLRELQFGSGGGFRYMSPIGPVRIDLGWKLNPSEEDLNSFANQNFGGVNRWAIHFSIGQAF
ncbi:MAG: BamA/OMP85 family outer membrane protein [Cyclonatronaceae bacterium]